MNDFQAMILSKSPCSNGHHVEIESMIFQDGLGVEEGEVRARYPTNPQGLD